MRDYATVKTGMRDLICTTLGRRGGRGVQKKYEKLQDIVNESRVILMDLQWRRMLDGNDDEVRKWFDKIEALHSEADDVFDELSYEAMRIIQMEEKEEIQKYYCMSMTTTTRKVRIINSFPSLLFRHRMLSGKIKDFQDVVDELKSKLKLKFPDNHHQVNDEIGHPLINSSAHDTDYAFQVYRRDEEETEKVFEWGKEKTEIVNKLLLMADHHPNININGEEETLCVIPIVEWEYVNTERLAKLIFDDESIKSHFDLRFWVNVPEIFLDVKRIVKEIVEQSPSRSRRRSTIMGGGGGGDLTNWNNLQQMLEEILSGKRFLLVLSDMLPLSEKNNKERWDNLITLLRVGSKGSTIIVTTPYFADALKMGTILPHILRGRSSLEPLWAVFRRNAFAFGSREGGAVETPDLVRIGLELVKFGSVNMWVSRILGAMMHFKTNIEEWTTVLNTMKTLSSSGHSPQESTLMICHNEMESPLKLCFAYCCSVFRRDFIIEKKKLIQLWMAQGFLEQSSSSSSINNGGGDHDDVILMEEEDIGNAYFKSLVLRSFLQVVKMDDKDQPLECRMDSGLRFHASIILESLIMEQRTSLDFHNNISPGELLKFKRLRVLELKHVSKDELPSSIGELMHLRYLDLSHGLFKEFYLLPFPNSTICKL
ncbi:disease resistance protein RGA2-like [Macadamia integrifolia]|uniref:disease resistance protein RGA2-like n=1 Tax=Macadamia integrifolia TaxID=60698 RepID=UPI001C4F4778|nr:disease resistance protein RGA2-like [Macadamia integrifolia]